MVRTLIANPPLGIYKNSDITIGQAFYLVHLDVHARVRRALGEEVSFPTYAFNVYGKRGDEYHDPVRNAQEYRQRSSLREKLSLCSNESISDDEPEIIRSVQKDFVDLHSKGYVQVASNGSCLLLCDRIKSDFTEEALLNGLNTSRRAERALRAFWKSNMAPVTITKPTKFSIPNPLDASLERIGPLFTLANMWDSRYKETSYVFAGSERNLSNYVFLRSVCRLALEGNSGINDLFIYPQVTFEGLKSDWDLAALSQQWDSDVLRLALLRPSLKDSNGTVLMSRSMIQESRKLLSRLKSLHSKCTYTPGTIKSHPAFVTDVLSFTIPRQVSALHGETKQLSERVLSEGQTISETSNTLYSSIIDKIRYICPQIIDYHAA